MTDPRFPTVHVLAEVDIGGSRVLTPLSSPCCDFCGHDSPAWDYDCHDFMVIEDPELSSIGGFAACTPCSDMIEADDWDGVLERCVAGARAFAQRTSTDEVARERFAAVMRASATLVHRYFRENRYGERRPWG